MANETPKKKKSFLRRFFKWTGITFLLLLIAIIVLPFIFKDKIIAIVKEQANENLNAKVNFGQFDLTLFSSFPDFRFKIDSVSVVGVGEFEGDTLASIKHMETDINLMSVIKGDQYKVNAVTLNNPRIFVEITHEGKASYDIAKPSTDTTGAVADTSAPSKFSLKLTNLKITDAVIVYDDKQGDMYASLNDFDFDMKGDITQDIMAIESVTDIKQLTFKYGGIAYLKDVNTKVKANLDMDMPNMKFTFKDNEFTLNELSLGLDGFVAMPKDDIDMDLKFKANQTEFKNILSLVPAVYTKDFASVKTSGKLALNGFLKGIYNDKTMPAFGTHLEIANAMFKYPSLPKSVDNINVNIDANNPNGNPDATVIDVNKFHVEMAGNPVDVVMHVKTPVSDPNLKGTVKGKVVLASVKEFVPLEKGDDMNGTITADIDIDGRMSSIEKEKYEEFKAAGTLTVADMNYKTASLPYEVLIKAMNLNFTPKFVELTAFDSKMGKTDIQANGKIEDFMQYIFKDSLIKGNFNMTSNLIDLNELMASTDTAAATPAAADTSALSIIEVPRNIDFVLNSKIGKVLYDTYDMTNMEGNIEIKNAKVDMTNLRMNMLDGSMVMNGYYETQNIKKPTINYNLDIKDFDIQKSFNAFNTVQKFAPIGKYAKGKFSTSLKNLKGTLNADMMPDMNTLSGNGNLKTNAVAVEGFEPFVKLADALKNEKLKKMEFSNVDVSYEFKDGRVQVKPFKTKVSKVDAEISGSTGFDQTIDYKWDMEMSTKDLPGQATSVVNNLLQQANSKGANLTMGDKVKLTALIGGTVTKPVIKTGFKDAMKDVKNDVKEAIKDKIEEVKTQVIDDAKAKASAEAEKLIAQAKEQAEKIKAEAAKLAESTKNQGYKAADSLEAKAKGPIEKIAAKKLAEKTRQEADKKAAKINAEAEDKSNKIIAEAQEKADKLKQ